MSLTAKSFDQTGKSLGEVTLSADVFDVKPKKHLLFDSVTAYLARQRQGTAKVKTRGEVRGGGKKPFKQKGTGNARQGTSRSPLMPGGGKIFGPIPRSYAYELPKKVRKAAVRVALSEKRREGKFFVVDAFSLKKPETKSMQKFFDKIEVSKALVVDQKNANLEKSVRNLKSVKYTDVSGVSVFDILKYDHLCVSKAALEMIQKELKS